VFRKFFVGQHAGLCIAVQTSRFWFGFFRTEGGVSIRRVGFWSNRRRIIFPAVRLEKASLQGDKVSSSKNAEKNFIFRAAVRVFLRRKYLPSKSWKHLFPRGRLIFERLLRSSGRGIWRPENRSSLRLRADPKGRAGVGGMGEPRRTPPQNRRTNLFKAL
jgi:hypothetical protein